MKHAIICLLSAALLMGVMLPVYAADEAVTPPHISFGAAGSYNWYNGWQRRNGDMHMRNEFSSGYGGGLVFEKMFNNILGINSGLWFNRMSFIMKMKQPEDIDKL